MVKRFNQFDIGLESNLNPCNYRFPPVCYWRNVYI